MRARLIAHGACRIFAFLALAAAVLAAPLAQAAAAGEVDAIVVKFRDDASRGLQVVYAPALFFDLTEYAMRMAFGAISPSG